MGLAAIENAVVHWIETSTGLAGKVVLSRQKAPVPALPYITVTISPPGRPRSPHPMLVDTFDETRPVGQEIETRVTFEHERRISVQAYTSPTTGDATAAELLCAARAALGLESTLQPLRDAGLALLDPGDVVDVTALVETTFQGRAVLDARFLVKSEATERVGYVKTIGLTVKTETVPGGPEKVVVDNVTVKVGGG